MKHIRPIYEQLGVDYYYKHYAAQYENPHEPQIRNLILRNAVRIDISSPLDFCCGGGEVTAALVAAGSQNITASDPFTHQLFAKHFRFPCHRWDFQSVLRGELQGQYSCIICSFALHLAPEDQLFMLAWQLLEHSPLLDIISPHKRPALEELEGIELVWTDFELTEKGKKVMMKAYKRQV